MWQHWQALTVAPFAGGVRLVLNARVSTLFFRMYGMLRFERIKIEEWLKRQSDTPVLVPIQSGKNGRPRKTKLQ